MREFRNQANELALFRIIDAQFDASADAGRENPVQSPRIKETLAPPHLWSLQVKVVGGDPSLRKLFWTVGLRSPGRRQLEPRKFRGVLRGEE
jgi:hypothetical protein